jgi:hypothetical protein
VTEGRNIVSPAIKVPELPFTQVAAALTALVYEHQLSDLGQSLELWLEGTVIEARAAMQQQYRPTLDHGFPVYNEAGTVGVEPERYITN